MGKGRRYDQEYKDMIVDLFKSGMSLAELSSEYGIAKSTINGWIKDVKEIKVDENEVMTLKEVKELKKEMARIKEENEILKKGYGHICNKKLDEVIEFINNNKSKHDIKTMCTVLGVARSTYYKSFDKTKSARELENEELKSAIKRIYKENKCIYGAPRIHYILGIEGFNVSLKRVQRLMTKLGLCAVTVKKYKPHSSKKVAEDLENVLKRDFTTTSINEKWVGDITYIHTSKDGWCYLASVLDLHSKKIIGYAFGKRMTNDLVVKALKNAYYNQNPDKNKHIIFHTDLVSQYTSNDLKELCKEFNIIQSFSKKGCPYDNACIESFHSSMKKEEIYRNTYRTFEKANIAIFKYIEGWYNRKKIHSSINYMTPEQYELLARSAA
ncbi:IS3 family transposase [uncultured Clostridium sp.]|uniref:IS3 family transposase n=1 Tax=uncultured Clostridium sp. TaxID=59620 RepID=UPI0025EAAA7C|nr:IS3 family transposase [uncultured Clostridium sp.]